jgi:lipopolysaccharide biosynthesis glycosyltransferase
VKPEVWEWWGYDLIALSSHKLLDHEAAVKYGELSLTSKPEDERLVKNLRYYKEALGDEKLLTLLNHFDLKDKNQKNMQLAFAFDDNYLYPFLIAIYSAALHSDEAFSVIVGDTGMNLSDESKKIIAQVCEKLKIDVNWCKISLESSFNRNWGHVAPITIGRLLLMDVLPSPFVYVDVDLVFLHGWQKLLSQGNFYSGIVVKAVEDAMPTKLKKEWTSIGTNKAFNSEKPYFNAGVLIVDPKAWREFDCPTKWKDLYLNEYDSLGFRFLDQDILNYLLNEMNVILPEQFNFQVTWGISSQENYIFPSKTSNLSLPSILHFIGSAKPWNYSKKSRDSFLSSSLSSLVKLDEESTASNIAWMSQYFWIEKLFWQWVQIQEPDFIDVLSEIYSRVTKVDF